MEDGPGARAKKTGHTAAAALSVESDDASDDEGEADEDESSPSKRTSLVHSEYGSYNNWFLYF